MAKGSYLGHVIPIEAIIFLRSQNANLKSFYIIYFKIKNITN